MITKKSYFFIIVISTFTFVYNIFLPIYPDGAYYWVWSRHLQLSYYDHPAMISYFIKIFSIFGNSQGAIRIVSIFCVVATALVIYKLAKEMFSEHVAEIALILTLFLPFIQLGLSTVTPGLPLMLFWSLTVYFFYKFLKENKDKYIYLTGICLGLSLLSKFPAVLLVPSFILIVIFTKRWDIFKKPSLYIAMVLTVIVFMPAIIWNIQNHFISIKYQVSHGVSTKNHPSIGNLLSYIGAQIGVFNPILAITGVIFLFVKIKDIFKNKNLIFLLMPGLFTLIFFLVFSINQTSNANWPLPAYVTLVIFVSYYIDKYKLKWVYIATIALTIFAVVLVKYPGYVPVLKSKVAGFPIIKKAENYIPKNTIILSDRYQDASEVEYYLPWHPHVYIVTPTKFSQYNLWSKKLKANISKVKVAYYIGQSNQILDLEKLFKKVVLVKKLVYKNKYIERVFYIYKCTN